MSTVTSSKRVEANRKNAARSTGPRSATGKCRSRFNAVKHGMAAKLPVLPGEDPDAFRRPPRRLDRRAPAPRTGRTPARRPRRACLLAAPAGRPRPGRPAGLRGPGRRRPAGRRPVRRGPRAGPTPLLGPAGTAAALPPPGQLDRPAVHPLLLVQRDRRPQRAGASRQPAREHRDRLRLAAGPLGRAAQSGWRTAGPCSRRSGSRRSGCWAGSRWTRRRTTGS